jgi:hypothetical protein
MTLNSLITSSGQNLWVRMQPASSGTWLFLHNRLNRLQTVSKLFVPTDKLNGNSNGYNRLKTFTNGNGWSLKFSFVDQKAI